jgi:pyruvate dehydrogenase E1 component alpha subunit
MTPDNPMTMLQDARVQTNEERLSMHRAMLRIRRVEEAIARLYPQQEIRCPTHLCIGQEAVPVAVAAHLRASDYAFSGHRSHGHYLAKGGDLAAMFAELYGRETGCARGRGGSQHLIDLAAGFIASAPILAGTVPVAVGAAYGSILRGDDRVSVVFIGDGATEEGVFHESMNFASVHRLPVVFVCENNLYSVHSAMDVRQPAGRTVADIGAGHGVYSAQIDGNDLDSVWRYAGEAIRRARTGGGPTLLECLTYRWMEHCGPNDDTALGYRPAEEVVRWQQDNCPIRRSESALAEDGLLTRSLANAWESEIASEIEAALTFAKTSPFPSAEELSAFTYPRAS